MYIKRLKYVNVGPIKNIDIQLPFDRDTPKPIIFVGENGCGKSILLSNIVDSMIEIASKEYRDVNIRHQDGLPLYYKTMADYQIAINEEYLCVIQEYIVNTNKNTSIFKTGKINAEKFCKDNLLNYDKNVYWDENTWHFKNNNFNKSDVKDIFETDVIAFFSPSRYENPSWIANDYLVQEDIYIEVNSKINNNITNQILVQRMTSNTIKWLLDLVVDSRADVEASNNNIKIVNTNISDLLLLSTARKNIETILSQILQKEVYFGLNYRNLNDIRFNIRDKVTGEIIIPSIKSLSTGQLALFNIFATIIRYADKLDIRKSIEIFEITGIVIIDEIELHLHSKLQHEILPKLLKLFPKIQFIITSHSPLFLLGMENEFGKDGFSIYQLPDGECIDSERFREFGIAYEYFKITNTYKKDILHKIRENTEKDLIITEGATDWKHMKAAYNKLSKQECNKELFSKIIFDFLEYEPVESDGNIHMQMSNSELVTMCEKVSKMPNNIRKIIFIADCDDEKINDKLSACGQLYKNWGNGVYSLVLPVPKHRQETPNICIEHYYTDSEIKTEETIGGTKRRLYMGNEFNKNGISTKLNLVCQNKNICGSDKINIIDGSSKCRVIDVNDDESKVNYALSKMNFANYILDEKEPFNNMDFSSFLKIFEILNDICNLRTEN